MAVEMTNPVPGYEDPDLDVLVSRQPVVDGDMRVTGYRVAYAALDGEEIIDPGDQSAIRLFGDFLSVVGRHLGHPFAGSIEIVQACIVIAASALGMPAIFRPKAILPRTLICG